MQNFHRKLDQLWISKRMHASHCFGRREADEITGCLLGATYISMTKFRWAYINFVYIIYSFWDGYQNMDHSWLGVRKGNIQTISFGWDQNDWDSTLCYGLSTKCMKLASTNFPSMQSWISYQTTAQLIWYQFFYDLIQNTSNTCVNHFGCTLIKTFTSKKECSHWRKYIIIVSFSSSS